MKYLIALFLSVLAVPSFADHDVKSASDRGTFVGTFKVSGSSVAGTAFVADDPYRMDAVYFNNTSSTIWIGTTTVTENNKAHSNILMGFPVMSSQTFKLDGMMTGSIAFTCNSGVSSCEVRGLEGENSSGR